MIDQGLCNYVRNSQANGKSDAEITEILRQNGQTDEQIHKIFDAVAGLVLAKPIQESIPNPGSQSYATEISYNPLKNRFAGFGIRFIATVIDLIIFSLLKAFLPLYVITLLYFLYNIVMLSQYGATIGKMVVGIKVISDKGEPVTVPQVLLREIVGKILSQILYIGYFMIFFTRYKQGLHDKIAETYVVYKNR